MNDEQALWLVQMMKARGARFRPGLSVDELHEAERGWKIRFPPDLAKLLRRGLPAENPPYEPPNPEPLAKGAFRIPPPGFPRWDEPGDAATAEMLLAPTETAVFDVRHSQLWLPSWGERPRRWRDAEPLVRSALRAVPRLLPINGHAFVPERPFAEGSPVIDMSGGEVERAANDIAEYMSKALGFERPSWAGGPSAPVVFWETEQFYLEDLGEVAPRGYWEDLPDEDGPPYS